MRIGPFRITLICAALAGLWIAEASRTAGGGELPHNNYSAFDIDSARVEWNRDSLPIEIRSRIHLRVKDIPLLSGRGARLSDYRSWPAVDTIDGLPCQLQMIAISDMIRVIHSIKDLRGDALEMRYECDPIPRHVILEPRRGPMYVWRDGRLLFGAWFSPGTSLDTSYAFEGFRNEIPLFCESALYVPGLETNRVPVESLGEFFARDGRLLGFRYSKERPGAARSDLRYLLGREVSNVDFEAWERWYMRIILPYKGPPTG